MQPSLKVPPACCPFSVESESEIDDRQARAAFQNVDLVYVKTGFYYPFSVTTF